MRRRLIVSIYRGISPYSVIIRVHHSLFPLSIAAYGELHFELVGFVCQCAAVAFEASRLVMIQILLHGLKVGFDCPSSCVFHLHCLRPPHYTIDGPTRLTSLLRTRLRLYQCLHHPLHRGAGAFLRGRKGGSVHAVDQRWCCFCFEREFEEA